MEFMNKKLFKTLTYPLQLSGFLELLQPHKGICCEFQSSNSLNMIPQILWASIAKKKMKRYWRYNYIYGQMEKDKNDMENLICNFEYEHLTY